MKYSKKGKLYVDLDLTADRLIIELTELLQDDSLKGKPSPKIMTVDASGVKHIAQSVWLYTAGDEIFICLE